MSTIAPHSDRGLDRAAHHAWLAELTRIPTAAGKEARVIRWIESWIGERPGLELSTDHAGNLHIAIASAKGATSPPLYVDAHLDHPAFVVDEVLGPGELRLAFRGGVIDGYFDDARFIAYDETDTPHPGALVERIERDKDAKPGFKLYTARLDSPTDALAAGDVATWELAPAEVVDGVLHTHACDNLASVAAALAAIDALAERATAGEPVTDTRLILTRAEEIGFVGAIDACKSGSIPEGARVIVLENSRSFEDSPIGGGPILRVGDRLSIFSPALSASIAKCCEELAGQPNPVVAPKDLPPAPEWAWQRKLMAGGACHASAYMAYGYEAACVCLPLGNYHNMADLTAVQAKTNATPPRVGREFIALSDFDGMVDILIRCGLGLPDAQDFRKKLDELHADRAFVLEE